MMRRGFVVVGSLLVLVGGCDEKKDDKAASAGSASAQAASAAPTVSTASAAPAAASAAPTASAAAAPSDAAPAKDAMVTVRDPEAEPKKTVKALPGGSVTLYLPEWPGTKWSVQSAGKELGKPKEETIPGFAGPKVMAKQLKWETTNAAIKPGQTYVVVVANTKKGEAKADKTFTLTIEIK
jgi:hypothetical protein